MANAYTSFFAQLPAAAHEISEARPGLTPLLNSVTTDLRPVIGTVNHIVNVPVFNSSYSIANGSNGDNTLSEINADNIAVSLTERAYAYFAVPDFDSGRSLSDIAEGFVTEAVQKIGKYAEGKIAALFTVANYGTAVTGGADKITDGNMAEALAALAAADVDVQDYENMFLTVHPTVYYNQAQESTWATTTYLGDSGAGQVRKQAQLGLQWGCQVQMSRFMPVLSGAYTCAVHHKSAAVLASRALPIPQAGGVLGTTVFYRGLPIRVTMDWNQGKSAETILVECLFGVAKARTDAGKLIVTS
jgi:hypothetical protein